MASVLFTWRPFIAMLWAALFDSSKSAARVGCIWRRQIDEPLIWIRAFLELSAGAVERIFDANDFFNRGACIEIYFDASTTGFGGFLLLDQIPVCYAYGLFTSSDASVLQLVNEHSRAQQAFEALALLIVLRMWLPEFSSQRVSIRVRGDNMAALSMLAKMQPKSFSLQVVARELALDLSQCSFSPDFIEHIPGVSNVTADALSRMAEHGSDFQLPTFLSNARCDSPPQRDSNWWLTRRAV